MSKGTLRDYLYLRNPQILWKGYLFYSNIVLTMMNCQFFAPNIHYYVPYLLWPKNTFYGILWPNWDIGETNDLLYCNSDGLFCEFKIKTIKFFLNTEAYLFVNINHRSSHSCLSDRALSNQNRLLLPHCITPFRRWYHLTFLTITPTIDIIPLTRSNCSLNDNVVQTATLN